MFTQHQQSHLTNHHWFASITSNCKYFLYTILLFTCLNALMVMASACHITNNAPSSMRSIEIILPVNLAFYSQIIYCYTIYDVIFRSDYFACFEYRIFLFSFIYCTVFTVNKNCVEKMCQISHVDSISASKNRRLKVVIKCLSTWILYNRF